MDLSRSHSLVLGAALIAAFSAPAHAQVRWSDEAIGRTAVLNMRSAMFPHPSRPQFTDDRVMAFVPRGYTPGPLVDVVVHYHGHRAEAVSSARERRLREQLAASGRGAILLMPQGPLNASDSAGGRHEERGGLQKFLDEAVAALVRDGLAPPGARVGRVILSGHSGAYKVIARGPVSCIPLSWRWRVRALLTPSAYDPKSQGESWSKRTITIVSDTTRPSAEPTK